MPQAQIFKQVYRHMQERSRQNSRGLVMGNLNRGIQNHEHCRYFALLLITLEGCLGPWPPIIKVQVRLI